MALNYFSAADTEDPDFPCIAYDKRLEASPAFLGLP